MINFIFDVKYTENFRYLLVKDEDKNNYLSQTKEVKIYYIKSHNSFPPIKIIDTPGFGDTSSIGFDKKNSKNNIWKFQKNKRIELYMCGV